MMELPDALQQILTAVDQLPVEAVPLSQAAGRFLATPIIASFDLPSFDNSAMDGYAVRANDVALATPQIPVFLRVSDRLPAGETSKRSLEPGTCARVFTGSALPSGADAVVMQEDTIEPSDAPDCIQVLEAAHPLENIRLKGEDIKQGTTIIAGGERLSAMSLAVIASLGFKKVTVGQRPKVALLATGNELLNPGKQLKKGKVFESNRASLAALLNSIAAKPRCFPLVPDKQPIMRAAFENAFATSDAVISTGGVSVGELDLVKQVFKEIGGTQDFWKVAIRPGKPFIFGHLQNKPFFGLPGNPVSALVTFLLLVRPALLKMQGARELQLPTHPAVTAESMRNTSDRRHFLRVVVDPQGNVRSAGVQASHVFSSLIKANALLDLPPHSILTEGKSVQVLRWQ